MVRISKVAQGAMLFPVGWLFSVIAWWIIPPIIEILGGVLQIDSIATLNGMMYFLMILAWVGAMLVLPTAVMLSGIKEPSQAGRGQVGEVSKAMLYLILALALTWAGWYMVTPLAEMMDGTIIKVIFYTGLLITWTLAIPVTTIAKISEHRA